MTEIRDDDGAVVGRGGRLGRRGLAVPAATDGGSTRQTLLGRPCRVRWMDVLRLKFGSSLAQIKPFVRLGHLTHFLVTSIPRFAYGVHSGLFPPPSLCFTARESQIPKTNRIAHLRATLALRARCTVSTAAHDKFSPVLQVRSSRYFFRGGTMKVAGNVGTIRKPDAELYYALDLPAFPARDSALLLSRILLRELMPPSSSLLQPVPLPGPSTRLPSTDYHKSAVEYG
ncbi:hypothetical protein B0H14DRAFT_2608658 [Mycena olivaceomarginata]|nr:hypothetical protein B0H14DRAFT_2608658 [Mycena olivaceomarginata]